MKIKVQLAVRDQEVAQEELVIEESRLGELTDEEIEQAIEVNIRTWLDRVMRVEWEVIEEDPEA